MLPSQQIMVAKLSKLQREFLIAHVNGLHPFTASPLETATRNSLVDRRLIEYVPERRSRLGCPDGTILTDLGHEALGMILGWCSDALVLAIRCRQLSWDRQAALREALAECAAYWRMEQQADNRRNL